MASSNRHWPSMFKSKTCNNHHWQQQHLDHNHTSLLSTGCHKPPYTSGPRCAERTSDPKPRWNPKPEQIRILEAIFNSGMVNPPRDEIRKIRAQLQEYGQVGDANVFYWFQNRKSRSKHKLRHPKQTRSTTAPIISSTSSSSNKSSPHEFSLEMTDSPTASVNKNPNYLHAQFSAESYLLPLGEFSFPPEVSSGVSLPIDGNMLVGDLLLRNNYQNDNGSSKKVDHNNEKVYKTTVDATEVSRDVCAASVTTTSVPSSISHFLGVGDSYHVGPAKSTVFINDVPFEMSVGPFNVCEAFGDDVVLIQSNGQPVFTNECGVTVQPLQHGGSYYLVRMLNSVPFSEAQLI